MAVLWWLLPLGILVGAFGTLVGAGGGFLLAPLLLLLYPDEAPETVASISLAVVFANALAGSFAYARMQRIDYGSGALLAAATVPGAILGALATVAIPRRVFDALLGVILLAGALALVAGAPLAAGSTSARGKRRWSRLVTGADGTIHVFAYDPWLAAGLSFLIGCLSSLLGIGGGIVQVPVLIRLLHFPVHVATATSQFTLAVMALAGTMVHVLSGSFHHGVRRTAALAVGVLVGAPMGAWLSQRIHGRWIIRLLALTLALVGLRLVFHVR